VTRTAPVPPGSTFADHAFTTASVDELESALSQFVVMQRLSPMTRRGKLKGAFEFHGHHELCVFDVGFGRRLSIDLPGDVTDERLNDIAFVTARSGSAQLIQRSRRFPYGGTQGIIFSGAHSTLQFSEDCEARVLIINRRKLSDHCAGLLAHDLDRPLTLDVEVALDRASGLRWQRTAAFASAELCSQTSPIRHFPVLWQDLEQLVHTTLLYCQPHNYLEELLQPQPAAAPLYVRRAEAFIEAHFAEPLALADIAAHARVSARSLQNGFRDLRGTTPMAFLRSLRLQMAHEVLLVADPAISTVSEVALLCGFTRLGEFANAYGRRYGVTPSRTLLKER
jgi:AraC-like DNA-binding protein